MACEAESHTLSQAELFHKAFLETRSADRIKILKLLSLPEGSRVLDLGCGTGEITYKLAEMAGSKGQVVGVDPDKERLEVARRNNKFTNLTFVEGDSATFPEDQYDLIFCYYVTDLIKDKETLYKRVYKNLRTGGQFACVAILQQSQLALELIELMGPKERKDMDKLFFFCPVEKFDELAAINGFMVSLKEEDVDMGVQASPESTIAAWKGISHGVFDPETVDQDGLETFKQKYKGQKMVWKLPIVRYILTKHSLN